MTTSAPRPPHPRRPERQDTAEVGHYTQVRSRLNAAEQDLTELHDLLNAGIAADDQSRDRAGLGGAVDESPEGDGGRRLGEPR